MSDVFISYAREDRSCAQKIAAAMETLGHSVWWDFDLVGGQDYREKIEEQLEGARCVVVLWSAESLRSRFVRDEAERGLERNVLVPASIEPGIKPPLGHRGVQTLDLVGWLESGEQEAPADLRLAVKRALKGSQSIETLQVEVEAGDSTPATSAEQEQVSSEQAGPEEAGGSPLQEPASVESDRHRHDPDAPTDHEEDGESLLKAVWAFLRSRRPHHLLTTRSGLALILGVVFGLNFLETHLETRYDLSLSWEAGLLEAFRWFEGHLDFTYHDQADEKLVWGASLSYFLAFLVMPLWLAVESWNHDRITPFRVLSLSVAINYAVSLPFFVFFPIQERWTDPLSGAMLLSDRLDGWLIEAIRPFSGLDNCFPSFHTSLTVGLVIFGFVYGMKLRRCFALLGATIVLATFALGIHWLPDIVAGASLGAISVCGARRLERKIRAWAPAAAPA